MTDKLTAQDLANRIELIESMMREGRQTTGRWGWAFILWGAAYLAASAWSIYDPTGRPWAVLMPIATILTAALSRRARSKHPNSTHSRSIGALWSGAGITLLLVLFALSLSGHYQFHAFVAIIGGVLGMTNFVSSMILRWRAQLFCAFVWWGAALAGACLSEQVGGYCFLAATFLAQIVFGAYVMIAEGRSRA